MVSASAWLGSRGVRINSIVPGTVEPSKNKEWQARFKDYGALAEHSLLKKIATPEEIANVIYSIAVEWTHATGQSFIVDGGQVISH